ncbi:hypothetical protein RhiirA4_525636 [Rhizophagus irregularis]|uniref:AAA+ ATPase domain-containing protein n=1 Tax=Rhizophagus irregularis TaxID=588596 RepID=A0A2I1GPS8_9GLOM|nr:hypothetical protein RhiirA4_525636 [Rhizophagus irregularis]
MENNRLSFTFHILLPENIERNGQPVILGDVKELGSWKNPIVKLRQPFLQNPTYWKSDPVTISVSNFEKIQYKYAIHTSKSMLFGGEEKIEFEGIDSQDNRTLNIEINDQFDIWKMHGFAFVDYIYDSIEANNFKDKVVEYQRLLTLHNDLTIRASNPKFIINQIHNDLKEKRLFLCILLGYYVSKREVSPRELPKNFPSNLLLNALENYKQEILPLGTKDQMYTAIITLIKHNAFQMKFDWLIIFKIMIEVDPNCTFIKHLKALKYSDENLAKFIERCKIIKIYTENIKLESYVEIAKWLIQLCYDIDSLLKIWNDVLIHNDEIDYSLFECFIGQISDAVALESYFRSLSKDYRDRVSGIVPNKVISLLLSPYKKWTYENIDAIKKLLHDNNLDWHKDKVIQSLELISQSHTLELLKIFPEILDDWFRSDFSDTKEKKIPKICVIWFKNLLSKLDTSTSNKNSSNFIFLVFQQLDLMYPLLNQRINIWRDLTAIAIDRVKNCSEDRICAATKLIVQIKQDDVKKLFVEIVKDIFNKSALQTHYQLLNMLNMLNKIHIICDCETGTLDVPNMMSEDILYHIMNRLQSQSTASSASGLYLNILKASKFWNIILRATGSVTKLNSNPFVKNIKTSINELAGFLLEKTIDVQLLQKILKYDDEYLFRHFDAAVAKKKALGDVIVSRDEIAKLRKICNNYQNQLDVLSKFYNGFCPNDKVTDVADYIRDLKQHLQNSDKTKVKQVLLSDHWAFHEKTMDSARNCYKFNRSQAFRNIFDFCIKEDAAAINVEYIAQNLIPIVFEKYNAMCKQLKDWEKLKCSETSLLWKNVTDVNSELDLMEDHKISKSQIFVQTLDYLTKIPHWIQRLEELESVVEMEFFKVPHDEDDWLSKSIGNLKDDSVKLSTLNNFFDYLDKNLSNVNQDCWKLIKELSSAEEFLSFLKKIAEHNIKNLFIGVDDYSDEGLIQEDTVSSLIQVGQYLLPFMNINDWEEKLDEENEEECKTLIRFVNSKAQLPPRKDIKGISRGSKEYFKILCEIGNELEKIFRNIQKQPRRLKAAGQRVASDVVKRGKLFIAACADNTRVPNIIMSLYANHGYYPEPWQLLICTSSTTMEELTIFIKRSYFASDNGYEDHLFCIANLELLDFELQYDLVNQIRSMQEQEGYLLALICCRENGIHHHILDQFSSDVKATNGLNNDSMRRIYRELCQNVIRVSSDLSGQGKTEWIKEYSFRKKKVPRSFLISDDTEFGSLVRQFKECKLRPVESLHINIVSANYPGDVNMFLFKLLTLGMVSTNVDIACLPPSETPTHIFIEIASTTEQQLLNSLPMAGYLLVNHISWNIKNLKASQEINSPIQVTCHYLNLLDRNDIDSKEILFRTDKAIKDPLPVERCQNLIEKYFFNKGNKDTSSFRFVEIFINVLADQLVRFSSNQFFTVDNLKLMVKETNIRNLILRTLIDVSKDFATRSIRTKEAQLESTSAIDADDGNARLGKIVQWDDLNHLIVFFNSQIPDIISALYRDRNKADIISALYRDRNKVHENIKTLLKSQVIGKQTKWELDDYNYLMSSKALLLKLEYLARRSDLPEYALSGDNLIKMALILLRARANIPVIVCGEVGCGKTSLISYLALMIEVQFQALFLHAGIDEKAIIMFMNDSLEKAEKGEIWLFFDEINTCNYIGLLADLISHRMFNGKPIHPNIRLFAACNPYRLRAKAQSEAGLTNRVKKFEEQSKLVYQVKPLPDQILDYVWDYGILKPDDEYRYIQIMVEKELKTLARPVFAELLFASQEFIRKVEERYSVSLRDVKRAIKLVKFFNNSLQDRPVWRKEHTYPPPGNPTIRTRSYVLALSLCYHFRLYEQDLRKQYRQEMEQILHNHKAYIGENMFAKIIREEQEDYINRMQCPPNTAYNEALLENVLVMIVCILTKIPLFLIGAPGSSKSLAVRLISSSLRGPDSSDRYFRKLAQVYLIPHQGSSSSTSEGIIKVFEKANKFQETTSKQFPVASVVLLDEVGLAETSPFNPLKVLHSLLEPSYPATGPTVSVIGIFNWRLDISKSSRALLVQRPQFNLNDLVDTAERLLNTGVIGQRLVLEPLAKAYEKNGQTLSNFHGLRDYYALVKRLSLNEMTPGNVQMELARNFGGTENHVNLCDQFFGNVLKMFNNHKPWIYEQIPVGQLIDSNLNDSDARHLMVISKSDSIVNLLTYQLRRRDLDPVIILGSQFPDDQEDYYYSVLRRIMMCVEAGRPLILTDLETIYGSLYDLWDQNYIVVGSKDNVKYFTRVALGAYSNPMLYVSPNFKCILVMDETKLALANPPLLNRFEKQKMSINDLLDDKQKLLVEYLDNWTNQITTLVKTNSVTGLHNRFTREDLFIGFDKDETLQSLIFHITMNNPEANDNEILEKCKESLIAIASPDGIIRAELSILDQDEVDRWKYAYFKHHHHNGLFNYFDALFDQEKLSADPKGQLVIINTFSKINIKFKSCLQDYLKCQVYNLSTIKTEVQITNIVKNFFFESNDKVLILQCDINTINTKCIKLVKYIIEQFRNEFLAEKEKCETNMPIKYTCIIFHIQRDYESSSITSNFICGWKRITIESLEQPEIPLIDLLDKSLYDIINSELFDKIVNSTMPFERILEELLLQEHYHSNESHMDPIRYYYEELDILTQDSENIQELIEDHIGDFSNNLIFIHPNFDNLQKCSELYYDDFIRIILSTYSIKSASKEKLDFIFRYLIGDKFADDPFILHIYWWKYATEILIQLKLVETFPDLIIKAQNDFIVYGKLDRFLFKESINLILQNICDDKPWKQDMDIILSINNCIIENLKNFSNLHLLLICNDLLKINSIPLEKIKKIIYLGKSANKQEFITTEIINLVFSDLDNNNNVIPITSFITRSLKLISLESEIRVTLYRNIFSQYSFKLMNDGIIEKIFETEIQQNEQIFFMIIKNPEEALQLSIRLKIINDNIKDINSNMAEFCCEIIQKIFSKFKLNELLPYFKNSIEILMKQENLPLQQITSIAFLKEFINKYWKNYFQEDNSLSKSLIKEINDIMKISDVQSINSYFILDLYKKNSFNIKQFEILKKEFICFENQNFIDIETNTNTEMNLLPKLWKPVRKVDFKDLYTFYIANLNEYPFLSLFFKHYNRLKLIKYLYPIIRFVKILNSKLEYHLTREAAQIMSFHEFIKKESVDEKEYINLKSLFEEFAFGWNSVISHINQYQSEVDKPFMTLDLPVIFGLVEQKDGGVYLCAIVEFLIKLHNEFLNDVMAIPIEKCKSFNFIKDFSWNCLNSKIYFTTSTVTQAQEKNFINYEWSDKILKYNQRNQRNLNIEDNVDFIFDLQKIEMKLARKLILYKIYFETENNQFYLKNFSFMHELFHNSPSILFNIKRFLPQEPILADKMKIVSSMFQKSIILNNPSNSINLSELLLLFEIILCFIKELSIKNNNILILNLVNQWLKLARYNVTYTDIFKEFSLKHIIAFYELIEEHVANSVIRDIDDKFKIPLTQYIMDSINNIIDYHNSEDQNQQLIPAKAFVLALKRFIYRYLLIDSNIENMSLHIYFLDFTLNLWISNIKEELIKELFPTCLLVSHAYNSYVYLLDEIEKASNERQNNRSFAYTSSTTTRKTLIKKYKKFTD